MRVVRAHEDGATTKEARLERGGEVLAGDGRRGHRGRRPTCSASTSTTSPPACRCPRASSPGSCTTSPASGRTCWSACSTSGLYERVAAPGPRSGRRSRADAGRRRSPASSSGLAGATPEALADGRRRVDELAALAGGLAAERPGSTAALAGPPRREARADEATAHARLLDGVAAPPGWTSWRPSWPTPSPRREQRCAELEDEATEAVAEAEAQLAGLPARARSRRCVADHGRRAELVRAARPGARPPRPRRRRPGDRPRGRGRRPAAGATGRTPSSTGCASSCGPRRCVRAGGGIAVPGVRQAVARPAGREHPPGPPSGPRRGSLAEPERSVERATTAVDEADGPPGPGGREAGRRP